MKHRTLSLGKPGFNINQGICIAVRSSGLALALTLFAPSAVQAQYSVLHAFTGGRDGANPSAGVTVDSAGNLYGTTVIGGSDGFGAVYQLKLRNGAYTVNPLYGFTGATDGANPYDRVVFGPSGILYGTASGGGQDDGGVVFKLQPGASACRSALCSYLETVLYNFPGDSGGALPLFGDVVFDETGNIYGTAALGGTNGIAFELSPPGTWGTEAVLDNFGASNAGQRPYSGVIFDSSGNLYGTTYSGGTESDGVVYQLVPAGPPWTENVVHNFQGSSDGANPAAGLVFDASGNLYGATTAGGSDGGGTVFELSPPGTWTTLTVLHSFATGSSCPTHRGMLGSGVWGTLTIDSAGNLYSTTCGNGAHNFGNVFELSPSGGGWTYTDLYDFTGGSDGGYPISVVTLDSAGNLYGTASGGGTMSENCSEFTNGCGVVWKITP